MDNKDMVQQLWSLANIIAGFSVTQSLAFAFALGRDFASLQTQPMTVKIVLAVFCVVFSWIYTFAVFHCYDLAMSVDQSYEMIWLQVTQGRVFCIWLFTMIPVFGLFATNIFKK